MRKLIFFAVAVVVIAMTGCKYETVGVASEYRIINRTKSDIVVKMSFGDRRVTTIRPDDTQVIYRCGNKIRYNPKKPSPVTERPYNEAVLKAEMEIDKVVISDAIWEHQYWEFDNGHQDNKLSGVYRYVATIIVTDELLETIKNQQN
jgi:hypothetical protein